MYQKNNVKVSFNQYFKHVGLPFMKILEEIGIKKNKKIKQISKRICR